MNTSPDIYVLYHLGMKMFRSRMILTVLDQIQKTPVYPTGSGESDGSQTVSNPHVNPYID